MSEKTTSPANRQALFRRAEDWERLTRLEFLVEELSKDNERRDVRIDMILETQEELGVVQNKMLRYARDIRMLLLGAAGVGSIFLFGWNTFIATVLKALFLGV
jgi:hypothetical protein